MQLTPIQRRRLCELLHSAFTENELKRLLRLRLNTRLDDLVPPGLAATVLAARVVEWAERSDRLPAFLEAATAFKPERADLRQYARTLQAGDGPAGDGPSGDGPAGDRPAGG